MNESRRERKKNKKNRKPVLRPGLEQGIPQFLAIEDWDCEHLRRRIRR